MKNYIEIDRKSLLFKFFAYLDTNEYLANEMFVQNGLKVFFCKTGRKKDSRYVIVICKVWKKDADRFVRVMDLMNKKMLLLGYGNFEKVLQEFIG